ncbi:MAG TPA: amidase [Xanthobacteraceae bacterium]|nr:amidase [Xanthobacteraceae bacterium]
MSANAFGSFFVPHDLESPIVGNADGPLAGLTAVVKDLFDIAGTRTGGGNPAWLAAQQPARTHAAAVAKILAAGATITGKAICDEFFFSGTGMNAHYGTPLNIRAPGRIPGGSSSGSAAAVAANACDFALGSDTGGSVRMPASYCGVYALRPTHGRIDLAGGMAMAPSFDTAGFFANAPGIARRVGAVLLDDKPVRAPISRLLVAQDALAVADAPVAALCREFLARAARALPKAAETTIAPDGFDIWREAFRVVQGRETWASFGGFVTRATPALGPGIKERMAYAATVTQPQAEAARRIVDATRAQLRAVVTPGTVVALPTAPCIAPPIDMSAEESEAFRVRVIRLGSPAVLAGLPQITIPVGTVAGCPAGLSFIGWAGGDEALLDIACATAKFCGIAA